MTHPKITVFIYSKLRLAACQFLPGASGSGIQWLREDVMEFAHRIVRLYYRIESERFWKKEGAARAVGDMIAFGIVAKSFGDRVITGPKVHTVFKTNGIGKETAWWQHK